MLTTTGYLLILVFMIPGIPHNNVKYEYIPNNTTYERCLQLGRDMQQIETVLKTGRQVAFDCRPQ